MSRPINPKLVDKGSATLKNKNKYTVVSIVSEHDNTEVKKGDLIKVIDPRFSKYRKVGVVVSQGKPFQLLYLASKRYVTGGCWVTFPDDDRPIVFLAFGYIKIEKK